MTKLLNKVLFIQLIIVCGVIKAEIINYSGPYQVNMDVVNSGDMFVITSSNVTFDLGDHIISGGSRGIVIGPNVANVTIQNGTISSLTGTGIVVLQGCSNINISNVHTYSCDLGAIAFVGTASSPGGVVRNCTISNCLFDVCNTGTSDGFVITFSDCANVAVRTVNVNNCGNYLHALEGIRTINSERMQYIESQVNNNNATNLIGFDINSSTKNVIRGCLVKDNDVLTTQTGYLLNTALTLNTIIDSCQFIQNTNGDITGIGIASASNSFITQCLIYGNTTTTFLAGININGNDNQLLECIVAENQTLTQQLSGFQLMSGMVRNVLEKCRAINNTNSGTNANSNCYGFNLDRSNFCKLLQCYAFSNRATGNGTSNIAAGFNISSAGGAGTGVTNCEFNQCEASFNNGFTDALSFGIRSASTANGNLNNIFTRCNASLNGPSAPLEEQQILSSLGATNSPGGVPSLSITSGVVENVNSFNMQTGNIRITQ